MRVEIQVIRKQKLLYHQLSERIFSKEHKEINDKKKGKEMTERKRSYNFFKGRKPGCLEMVYTKLSWSVQNKCLEKDKLEQTERNMRR